MNKQKQTYLSPETETLVVRFEDSILQAASPAVINAMGLYDFNSSNGNLQDDSTEWGF